MEEGSRQEIILEEMRELLIEYGSRLTGIENYQLTREEIPVVTKEDIDNIFRVERTTLVIGGGRSKENSSVGKDDVGNIPVDSAFLLVYAAEGDGKIMKTQTSSSPPQVSTDGKQFMTDDSPRESARWVEALDRLISWGWVKPVGYKDEIFELTGTGYDKADWLKEGMEIDTSKDPLEELQEFDP